MTISSGDSIEGTGVSFTGQVSYDDVAQLLSISLTNTSGFQSVITEFYFNIDGDASASYNAVDDPATVGVDESAFAFSTELSPFGTWDAGADLTDHSMQQAKGIGDGETGVFTFNISGLDAASLGAISFLTETNSGGGLTGAFAVRYQSVGPNGQLSDKVLGVVDGETVIPLPPAVWTGLASLGLIGFGRIRNRFRTRSA